MRKESSVIKRIMRSLPADVLKRTLAKVWKKYHALYGNKYTADSLKHVSFWKMLNFQLEIV